MPPSALLLYHARYDALSRLATAGNQSGFSPSWGQSFAYDGFGNLTGTSVTQGSAPTLSATYDYQNHAGGEDYNGNPTSIYLPADGSSYSSTWDVENRLTSTGASTIFYSYAPGNRRVWRGTGTWTTATSGGSGQCNTSQWSTDEITFWGINGQKLMTCQPDRKPRWLLRPVQIFGDSWRNKLLLWREAHQERQRLRILGPPRLDRQILSIRHRASLRHHQRHRKIYGLLP